MSADYEALLDQALDAYADLDEMLDGFLDTAGATVDEINQSRRLYNRIAAVHRALGRNYQDIPLDGEDGEEEEERELADVGGIPA